MQMREHFILKPLLRGLFFSYLLIASMTLYANDWKATGANKEYEINQIDISLLKSYDDVGLTQELLDETLDKARKAHGDRLSLDELSAIADDLGKLYRDKGFKFHSVFVPPQKLDSKRIARITMLEAKLGDINVRGEDENLNKVMALLFQSYLNKPLYQPDIDKVVLGIKSKFGVEIFSYYSRGSLRGQIRLNIKATRKASWVGSFSADNFGSESTGKERVTLSATKYDPTGNLDALTFGVQQVVDGETNTYGFLEYELPIQSLDHSVTISVSNNQFEVGKGFEELGLEGDAKLAGIKYEYVIQRSFDMQQLLSFRVDYKANDYNSALNDPDLENDEVNHSASLAWSINYRPIASSWSYSLYASFTEGEYERENTNLTKGFSKGFLSQQIQWALGQSDSSYFSSLRWSVSGQYVEDELSSFELKSTTGAYGVRAFSPGYFAADRGYMTHVEWWLPNLIPSYKGIKATPFVYYDRAYGERLDQYDDYGTRVFLEGSGAGLQVTYGKNLVLSASKSLTNSADEGDNPAPEEQGTLIKMNYLLSF